MPALDKIHEAVIRALEKQGWRVERDPFVIYIGDRLLYIDLMIRHLETQRTMLVEIKTFDGPSPITALALAVGKYLIYQRALTHRNQGGIPLRLAIPSQAFNGIFSEKWVHPLLEQQKMKLIVIDIESEEITAWT